MPASREEQIDAVEALIGIHFPREHRRLLLESDGWSTTYGDVVVQFLGIEDIRSRHVELLDEGQEALDGFVTFASDGRQARFGYDSRVDPPVVVMIDISEADWASAMLQAPSFHRFTSRLTNGKGLDYSTTYASPGA